VRTLILLLMLAGFAAVPAKANMTAGELNEACHRASAETPTKMVDALAAGQCQGFVRSWMEMTMTNPVYQNGQLMTFSWKNNVTIGQMIRVYCLFIKNHPERENEAAVFVLLRAADDAGILDVAISKP
jgi:hypothetical protein